MKVVCLIENTSCYADIEAQHGLSFYIESNGKKIIFDTGASDRFLNNAKKRNVDLTAVDTIILSHGHYDHTGGLHGLLQQNDHAVVYMREWALEPHYSLHSGKPAFIGIPENSMNEIKNLPPNRIHFTQSVESLEQLLGKNCFLFSNVTGNHCYSKGNDGLLIQQGEAYVADPFIHEQNLVIEENGRMILFSGCSHSGVINIMEACKQLTGKEPDILIGGFHFQKPRQDGTIDTKFAEEIAARLQNYCTKYYTCHCTRVEYYEYLKQRMGDQICYIGAGDIKEIG